MPSTGRNRGWKRGDRREREREREMIIERNISLIIQNYPKNCITIVLRMAKQFMLHNDAESESHIPSKCTVDQNEHAPTLTA